MHFEENQDRGASIASMPLICVLRWLGSVLSVPQTSQVHGLALAPMPLLQASCECDVILISSAIPHPMGGGK